MRKRDQLLESGSEFGGDDDFAAESDSASVQDEVNANGDSSTSQAKSNAQVLSTTPAINGKKPKTMGGILKAQLEETRQTLKSSIEARLRSEK